MGPPRGGVSLVAGDTAWAGVSPEHPAGVALTRQTRMVSCGANLTPIGAMRDCGESHQPEGHPLADLPLAVGTDRVVAYTTGL